MTDLLDEILIKYYYEYLIDLGLKDDEIDFITKNVKAQILKHYRSVKDIEAAIGENDIEFSGDKNYGADGNASTDWFKAKGRDDLRADIRKKLGVL